jgi:hypothetical protein
MEVCALVVFDTISNLDVSRALHEVRALQKLLEIVRCPSDDLLVLKYRKRFSEYKFVADEHRGFQAGFWCRWWD